MAVRELKDPDGTIWRVWCITPEAIHPITRSEDYLEECYKLGWLVYETAAGDRKRRLCPFPENWDQLGDDELRALRERAEVVPTRKSRRDRLEAVEMDHRAAATEEEVRGDLTVVRTFLYPGGRLWTASLAPDGAATGSKRPVLRFTSGTRSIDAKSYPGDWPELPDDRLVDLLRLVATRKPMMYTDDTPRRRWNDPPKA